MGKAKKMLLILEEAERKHFKQREQNRNKGSKMANKSTQTEEEWLTVYRKTKNERGTEIQRSKRDDTGKHQCATTLSTPSCSMNKEVDKLNTRKEGKFPLGEQTGRGKANSKQ